MVSGLESMAEICDPVIAGLSCFPWNGSNCSVHDMMLLLTESYLSDYHIDDTLTKLFFCYQNQCGAEADNCHTFLTRIDVKSILMAYMSGPTSTSQSADNDEGLRGTGWGEGRPVYLET